MGCYCSKSSAVEDSQDSPEGEFSFSKWSLLEQNAPRLDSSRRAEGPRTEAKPDGSNIKIVSHDEKVDGPNQGLDNENEKHKEKLEAIVIDYPSKGSVLDAVEGKQVAAGWPAWFSAVAGDAITGWLPRRADSFEKLEKIGQGTYSSVYKARDIIHNKLVALKRVRFDNLDRESIKFMAREIVILRKLDHTNVIKLEGLIISSRSCSLYLVFEYMEHDLTGLASHPGIKFTEPQVKCYMQQLLRGLDYCHSRGVLHRDIKGSNLLINNKGVLKIADFGLANFFDPHQSIPLTSRVVTLWYRPPELLLGDSHYGVAVDLWSAGCILAELYTGAAILTGKTEVEQLHKIFKLCGSPSEDYWRKLQYPRSIAFKPAQPYQRCIKESFTELPAAAVGLVDALLSVDPASRGTAALALKNKLFTTKPLACKPSTLPKYPPSKEIDARRNEGARRQEKVWIKDHKVDTNGKRAKESRANLVTRANPELNMSMPRRQFYPSSNSRSEIFDPRGRGEEPVSGFLIVPPKNREGVIEAGKESNRPSHSGSLRHTSTCTSGTVVYQDRRDRASSSHSEAMNQEIRPEGTGYSIGVHKKE